jgi:hypothetical protein
MFSLLSVVHASDMTYQKGNNINLPIPCVLNDASCLPTTNCNLTVNYPDGTNLIKNVFPTNNLAFENYTIQGVNITQLGEYQVIMFCNDNSTGIPIYGYTIDNFEVTSTGATNEFLINLAICIFVFFAILLLIIGINKEDPIILILSSMLFIFAGSGIYYNPLVYFPSFINVVLSLVLWGMGVYILIADSIRLAEEGW